MICRTSKFAALVCVVLVLCCAWSRTTTWDQASRRICFTRIAVHSGSGTQRLRALRAWTNHCTKNSRLQDVFEVAPDEPRHQANGVEYVQIDYGPAYVYL